jgi:glutaredoxin
MKVELLVSEWCASCHDAERVWRQVAEKKEIEFAVVDMAQPEGRDLATRLRIRSIPAVVVDDELRHVGTLDLNAALALVAAASDRQVTTLRHVGLGLSSSSRAAILGAMGWLIVAGAALPLGGLLPEAGMRPVMLHAFNLGFLVLLIMGLGEHMLPRFAGEPIAGGWLWAWLPQALVHAGVIGLMIGWSTHMAAAAVAGALAATIALGLFTARLVPLLR